jgi:hypothetical protein
MAAGRARLAAFGRARPEDGGEAHREDGQDEMGIRERNQRALR